MTEDYMKGDARVQSCKGRWWKLLKTACGSRGFGVTGLKPGVSGDGIK
jgi:hypothetical protein